MVIAIYIDDYLIIAPSNVEVMGVYYIKTKFEVTNEGPINEYLGVKVERSADHSMKLSQPLLTQQISRWNGIQPEKKGRLTLALSSQILERDTEGEQKLTT